MSIYDLVYDYIRIFYAGEKLNREQKKTIHMQIKGLLKNGWCSSELSDGFRAAKKKHPTKRTLKVSALFGSKRPMKRNLLAPGTFYYHNDLRLTCAPPKRQIDYDSGEVTVINEPYFLEMKASYTVDDLVDYYVRFIPADRNRRGRLIGSFNWLLKTYPLELILFMIDTAINMCLSEDRMLPDSPLDIQRYSREAELMRTLKETETIYAGGKKIVRKSRVR